MFVGLSMASRDIFYIGVIGDIYSTLFICLVRFFYKKTTTFE
ncbi:hypothetical protein NT08PM_1806 [Pasteurella multocida subsp. multocida str. 3480]|nr:hypothetical protein NT08PM_1806 [Pasteurella multocida subsp. multocida str. 3480]